MGKITGNQRGVNEMKKIIRKILNRIFGVVIYDLIAGREHHILIVGREKNIYCEVDFELKENKRYKIVELG
jgi:hypothetical protein